jgi:hypothetical protein
MTTSKSGLANLPVPITYEGQSSEEQAKIQELQRVQQELRDALQNRQQLFDPVLLAMAQGFLSPTKTGSFGEAIANTAALVGPAQAQAEKERRERLMMEKELAAIDLGQIAEGQKRRLGAGLLKPGQPMNPEEFQRYAQLVGHEPAARMVEIRSKMDETQRQELFRTIMPELLAFKEGKPPTLPDMLAIAQAKNVDPKLVLDLYQSITPKPMTVGEGSVVVQPQFGGGPPVPQFAVPPKPITVGEGQTVVQLPTPGMPPAGAPAAPQGVPQSAPAMPQNVPQGAAPVAPQGAPSAATPLYTAPRKPLEIERKVALLQDPATNPELKLALALELYKDGVDVKRVLTQGGEMTVSTLDLLNRQLPQIMKSPPSAPPAAAPTRPAVPQTAQQAAPQAATRSAEAPSRAVPKEERTFGPGKFAIPGPGRIEEAPTGFSLGSKEDLEARQQQTRSDTERFNEAYKEASQRGQAATRTIPVLETALRAVQSADFRGGIVARPEQLANQIKTSLGLADNVDVSRMLKTGVVDQALREQVLQNLRASFGGNPTEGERAFLMSVNSISDPRELLTYTLMGKMAAAQKDATKFDYLRTYGKYGTAAEASFDRWSAGRGPEAYYPPLAQAREQLLNSAAIAEQWKSKGGYQPDKYDYELRDGVWHRRPKQR